MSTDSLVFNMSKGVTALSRSIYDLHMLAFWICTGICAVVFAMMIYAIVRYRASRHPKAKLFNHHTYLEIFWATVPMIILVCLAIPATRLIFQSHDTSRSDLTIKIVGYQWNWKYEYLDHHIQFFSNMDTTQDEIHDRGRIKSPLYLKDTDKHVVVPVGKKIRFIVTANDVIHSWWVPMLGIKQDAIPGFAHESWAIIEKPGIYYGACAELCGAGHAFMPIVVEAVSESDFQAWVKKNQMLAEIGAHHRQNINPQCMTTFNPAYLMRLGKRVYEAHCAVCHKSDGRGASSVYPSLIQNAIVMGPVTQHLALILYGKKNTAMQGFASLLTDEELAAVMTYQRMTWGRAQQAIQPGQIYAARSSRTLAKWFKESSL